MERVGHEMICYGLVSSGRGVLQTSIQITTHQIVHVGHRLYAAALCSAVWTTPCCILFFAYLCLTDKTAVGAMPATQVIQL